MRLSTRKSTTYITLRLQFLSRSDAYDIVTFLPGKIREIEWQRRRIEELEAQARMLVWMEREVEK